MTRNHAQGATEAASAIEFQAIRKVFRRGREDVVALDGVDLRVGEKEFVAIVGPSGCGKTTLMRMAAGLEFPSSGQVRVHGRDVRGPSPERAVVFQQFALFPWKTVEANIAFGLRCTGMPAARRREVVARYIELMGLQGHEQAYPQQLSGGMQQRVAIARSYALDPQVLLMDEPFGALDAQTRVVMQEELVRLCRVNPRTVLFITHSVEEAVYLADRVVVLGRRPSRIREILDIATVRREQAWESCEHIEEVMDLESFVKLRTRIWRLLREQHVDE
ncbi:MAG: ABC transporter ATP-binding protein, partial [Betaproteobacteria bacterium]|nr:ABC transporter ATP-binding protein [Betaproteobacteria bacterium]